MAEQTSNIRHDSDMMGDQIGESVDNLLVPSEIARSIFGEAMESKVLARLVRNAVGVALLLGWKPEHMSTPEYHDHLIEASLKMYLDRFGEEAGFNAMKMSSMGKEFTVMASTFVEGDQIKMGDWSRQVEYARNFMKKRTSEEKLRFGLEEAVNIVELETFFEKTRKRVAKRNKA